MFGSNSAKVATPATTQLRERSRSLNQQERAEYQSKISAMFVPELVTEYRRHIERRATLTSEQLNNPDEQEQEFIRRTFGEIDVLEDEMLKLKR